SAARPTRSSGADRAGRSRSDGGADLGGRAGGRGDGAHRAAVAGSRDGGRTGGARTRAGRPGGPAHRRGGRAAAVGDDATATRTGPDARPRRPAAGRPVATARRGRVRLRPAHRRERVVTAGVVDPGLLRRVRARLAAEPQALDAIVMAAAVRAEADGLIGDTDMVVILRELETELTGTGVLAPLLTDPAVTDVLVNAPDQVWTDGVHGLRRSSI